MLNLVKINISYKQVATKRINDNYRWHNTAWELFSHHEELKERGRRKEQEKGRTPFLTRITQKSQFIELLVLSRYTPKKPDWCAGSQWQVKTVSDEFLSQKYYWFDVYANPTRAVKKPDGYGGYAKNKKRLTLLDKSGQTEWMERKSAQHGFEILTDVPLRIERGQDHFFKRNGEAGLHIGVRFCGLLGVKDIEKFKLAFIEGIGSAKSFGFGMLLIKPAQL